MPLHRRKACVMGAVLLLALGVAGVTPASAGAASPSVHLRLISQRPWVGPRDGLGVVLRLDNTGSTDLHGFLLRVAIYDRITSRSDLHLSFGGTPRIPASVFTRYSTSTMLRAGRSLTLHLDQSVRRFPSLGVVTDGGVFPLTFYLYDASGRVLLDSLTTSLIFYPQPPSAPLDLVLVVPLATLPAEGPDGVFHPDPAGRYPLGDALAPSGWLHSLVAAMDEAVRPPPPPRSKRKKHSRPVRPPPLRLALAPSPRLIAEIADMSDGYARESDGKVVQMPAHSATARAAAAFLKEVASLARTGRMQTMLTPYAFADLPSLDRNFDLEHLAGQLQAGEDVIRSRIGAPTTWLFPPGGRLDAPTLDDLRLAGRAPHAIVSHSALQPPSDPATAGCPSSFATFACPIKMRSESSASTGFESDPGLGQRVAALSRPGDDPLDLQRFLAETSMIQAETPGVTDRVVASATSPMWRPSASVARAFFTDLARAPWLRTRTPEEAVQHGLPLTSKRVITSAPRLANEPPDSYFSAISSAEAQVQHYASTLSDAPRPPQLLAQLREDVLVAQSRLWWSDPVTLEQGASYVSLAQAEATRELNKVSIGGVNEISMTSQRAQIPFVLSSRADYPVTVNVKLSSPKLGFDRSQLHGVVVQHGTQQIAVEATAHASGIFPVEVTVETSDGYVLAQKSIQIRSTNFNEIALVITGGALAFLITFYVAGAIKKRRERAAGPTEGTSTA